MNVGLQMDFSAKWFEGERMSRMSGSRSKVWKSYCTRARKENVRQFAKSG